MLAAFRSLSLRASAAAPRAAAPSSAFLSASSQQQLFSSASTDSTSSSSASEDATAAFLDATAPAAASAAREVKTMKKDLRVSPRKLTYLAQQIRGLPAQEALLQMKFSPKRKAALVHKTVQNAINLADIKFQIEPENLQVAECFVNKGHYLKRLRIMGRGRSGVMHHPHTHLTVVLREFDPSKKPLNRFLTKKLARETAAAAKKVETRDE